MTKPWGRFSDGDYTPAQLCRAALIDLNPPGEAKAKALCRLPIREPDGTLNRNALGAAAGALAGARGGVAAPAAAKRRAARRLAAAYREADMEAPEIVRRLAG